MSPGLKRVPKKLIDLFEEKTLYFFEKRALSIDRMIPSGR
jgi:hypothetical protein